MTRNGGSNSLGLIFEFDLANNLYSKKIDLSVSQGSVPNAGLTKAANGKLYGLTNRGGVNSNGTLFEYDPATNTYIKRYDFDVFNGPNGYNPNGILCQASNGKLYGVTDQGGLGRTGVIFEFDFTSNSYTKKIDLNLSPDSYAPRGGLVQTSKGRLFGATTFGGAAGFGALFEYDLILNTITKKIDLTSQNGSTPSGGLREGPNDKLYGLTLSGGVNDAGVLYEYDIPTNTYTKKVEFSSTNGLTPTASLLMASNNKFYGMARSGGANNGGTLFEFDPATNNYQVKYNFILASGSNPRGDLVQAPNGRLYGLTQSGGANSQGVLFEFDLITNTYTKKIDLSGTTGRGNFSGMILSSTGTLLGVMPSDGSLGGGVVFEYDLVLNNYVNRFDLSASFYGSNTTSKPILSSSNGKLYAMAGAGGSNNLGTFYEFNLTSNTITKKTDFTGLNGALPAFMDLIQLRQLQQTQTITFSPIQPKTIGDPAFSVSASSSAGLPISFTSASTNITISNGQVTMLRPGRVKITASQPGNAAYLAATPVDQEFCINPTKPTIAVSYQDPAKPVLTSSSNAGVQWFKNGVAISGATASPFTVTEPGSYSAQITIETCSSERSAELPVVVTSLENGERGFTVFPNPTEDKVTLQFRSRLTGEKHIRLLTLEGKLLNQKTSMKTSEEISLKEYVPGIYLISVSCDGVNLEQRVVKK